LAESGLAPAPADRGLRDGGTGTGVGAGGGAGAGTAPGALRRRLTGRASGFLLIAALLLLWQVSAQFWVDSPNWPPLTEIARALAADIASGELVRVFAASLYRMIVGYGIGAVAAVLAGLLMATIPLARRSIEPLVELLRPVPIPAIVPPLILLLGVEDKLKIFIVAFSTFFPVLVNTVQGVRAIDPIALSVARTFRVPAWRILLRVVLPASLPYVMAGLRVSLALALVVTVVAEMIAGSDGIGYYLTTMQYAMRAADMYAAIFVLAAIGYGLNRAFLVCERRLLHWYRTKDAAGKP
jgi:NitT/TauT family transport system permease protein/sulfonate transport system permease protein